MIWVFTLACDFGFSFSFILWCVLSLCVCVWMCLTKTSMVDNLPTDNLVVFTVWFFHILNFKGNREGGFVVVLNMT